MILTYKPIEPVTVTLAPAFYCYLLHGSVGLSGNAVGPSGRSSPNDVNTANPLQPTQGGLAQRSCVRQRPCHGDRYVAIFNGDGKFPPANSYDGGPTYLCCHIDGICFK